MRPDMSRYPLTRITPWLARAAGWPRPWDFPRSSVRVSAEPVPQPTTWHIAEAVVR